MELLENHIRSLYRFLNHGSDYSDMRCIDVNNNKFVSRDLVKGEQEVVAWAKKYNGKGNCFIGRNPRKKSGDVSRVTSFSLDLDPVRDKGTSSDETQLQRSFESGRRILQSLKGGFLGCSGNGALLLFRLRNGYLQDKEVEERLSALQKQSRILCDSSIKIDNTQDNPRMIKLLGTMSMKGEVHRLSRFMDIPTPPYLDSDALDHVELEAPVKKAGQVVTDYSLTQTQRLQMLEKALPLLKKERVDDYDSWIKIGMACKEFGLVGFRLWDVWSKKSDKYSDETTDTKWRTFDEQSGITIGSIIHWAREDSGQAIRPESSQSQSSDRQSLANDDILFSPNGNLSKHKEWLFKAAAQGKPEFSLGLPVLDGHTWGYHRGEVYIIGAGPGVGKTSLIASVVNRALQQDKRVLFFSTEMSRERIINCLLSSYCAISGYSFISGKFTEENKKRLDDGYKWLEGIGDRLTICDVSSPTFELIQELPAKLKPDVIVFDHIQHIDGGNDERIAISKYTKGLKNAARDANCAVLILSQFRRLYRDPKTSLMPAPQLSDLKGSGTLEQVAGQVLLLSEHSVEPGTDITILIGELAKNRFGNKARIGIEFDRSTSSFKETLDIQLDKKE